MNRSWIFPVLLVFLFLAGCSSQGGNENGISPGQEAQATTQSETPVQTVSGVSTFSLNQKVIANDTAFTATAWGYAPTWGTEGNLAGMYRGPAEGAKFLWVHIIFENVGDVPIIFPERKNFRLLFRGVDIEPHVNIPNGRSFSLPFRELEYPGTEKDGYLVFEVPEGLGDDEATLLINFSRGEYEMQLSNPEPYEGPHLVIKNYTMECGPSSNSNYLLECSQIHVIIENENHATSTDVVLNILIGGHKPEDAHVSSIPFGPTESRAVNFIVPIGLKKSDMSYYLTTGPWDQVEIGKPGDEVPMQINITEEGNDYYDDQKTFRLELPLQVE